MAQTRPSPKLLRIVAAFSTLRARPMTPGRKHQARSSVVEHYLDMVGVGSSILPAPTKFLNNKGLGIPPNPFCFWGLTPF